MRACREGRSPAYALRRARRPRRRGRRRRSAPRGGAWPSGRRSRRRGARRPRSTTGKTTTRSSSTRSCSIRVRASRWLARDDDLPVQLLLQPRDLGHHVALEDGRVVPLGIFERRRHDVLGHAVEPVRELATPRLPAQSEELVAPRPSSHASARNASSSASLLHSSRSVPPNSTNQPPSPKPSWPSGSCTTPSSDTFCGPLSTILPISALLSPMFPVEALGASRSERRISVGPDVGTSDACQSERRCEDAGVTERPWRTRAPATKRRFAR